MKPASKEYYCHTCNHTGEPIIKMGALLCEKCRILLFYAYSPEWNEAVQVQKAKKELKQGA